MEIVIDRRAAGIHLDLARFDRLEIFFVSGKRIVKFHVNSPCNADISVICRCNIDNRYIGNRHILHRKEKRGIKKRHPPPSGQQDHETLSV